MKKLHIIALVLIAGLAGFFVMNLSEETSEYADFQKSKDNPDMEFHVVGQLIKTKPQKYDPIQDPNFFEFYMADDKGQEAKVVYKGAKPDGFDQTEKIVVAGKYSGNTFLASQILMKCPSKYVDEKVTI